MEERSVPTLYRGNRLELLAELLGRELFAEGDLFTRRLLIVPSSVMQSWLQWYFAESADFSVFMGVRVVTLQQALEKVVREFFPGERIPKFPEIAQLELAIEAEGGSSHLLGKLFYEYGIYGSQALKNGNSLQAQLYRRLFEKFPQWGRFRETVEKLLKIPPKGASLQLHLFGHNFIPTSYLQLFEHLGSHAKVCIYQLAPSPSYLGELCETEGISPFLASFGSLAALMQKELEELSTSAHDCFVPSKSTTALESVQASMLANAPLSKVPEDSSIELHSAPTPQREVEFLFDKVQSLAEEGVAPHEILVMAPDISRYAPYIHALFSGGELEAHLFDLQEIEEVPLFSALNLLFSLAKSRFDVFTVMRVIAHPLLRKFHGVTPEEEETLLRWVEKAQVRWGFDGKCREQTWKNHYGNEQKFGEQGTWSEAFHSMVHSFLAPDQESAFRISPLETPLFGKIVATLRALKKLLMPIHEQQERTLIEWSSWLGELFTLLAEYAEESSDVAKLHEFERELRQMGTSLPEARYKWDSIERALQALFCRRGFKGAKQPPRGVRFCSLMPMRALPARVVVLLGMSDAHFPGVEEESPQDLLVEDPASHRRPSRSSYDRALFLEALISAREKILFCASFAEEGDEFSPYIVELLGELGWSEECCSEHPFFAHQEEETYLQKSATKPREKTPLFSALPPLQTVETFTLRELKKLLTEPTAFYVQKSIGITLSKKRDLSDTDTLSLSGLEKHKLRGAVAKWGVTQGISRLERSAQGSAGKALFAKDVKELYMREAYLREEGIRENRLFTANFEQTVFEPEWIDAERLLHPAIDSAAAVVGVLEGCTTKGLLLETTTKKAALVRYWPQILAYLHLAKSLQMPPVIHCMKECKKVDLAHIDPENEMRKLCLHALSLLSAPKKAKELASFPSEESVWLEDAEHEELPGESYLEEIPL